MKYIIGNILFLAAILLIIARFLSVWAGTPFPINLVTSNSMDPVLMKGDVVAWTPSRIEDIEVGDVVVYKSHINWPDEKLLVHRVTEIKHDTAGNILLETKGDANKYPDQEGPHIPEPYVREENLMGKTISIGNQPLKIPLVGMFGIWVSDGIESISQPSTSKESISYLGIFAPLTISAIILVVLIFIIPERAKTIKKKIKLYVFGPKQIGVKKTIIVFLIMYFVFFTLIHCFAFDSISASVGIEDKSPSSDVNFGRITQGKKSFPKDLPVFNPSVSTVKGVIYADGEIEDYISRDVFELPPGKSEQITLEASASNKTNNGSYSGDIMVYSSPFWVLFPDDFMQDLVNENPQMTIFYLDFLSALILTTITAAIIISVTLISKAYNLLSIDLSWRHANRPILKKQTIKKMAHFKRNLRKNISKKIGWILKIDFTEIKNNKITSKNYFKPLLASLIIIPFIFILKDAMLAMIIAVFLGAIIAYYISCKARKKIVLTVFFTIIIAIIHMMIQSNIIIFTKDQKILEMLSFSLGAIGIYLLVLGLLLIPLSLLSTMIIRYIRNVKEQKEPLLMLEGECDL